MQKLILFSLLLSSLAIRAETVQIDKVVGKKAVVSSSENINWQKGDSLDCSKSTGGDSDEMMSEEKTTKSISKSGLRKRDHGFDLSTNYTSATAQGSSTASTNLSLSGAYILNYKSFEVAPSLSYSSIATGGSSTSTSTILGIQARYNFIKNQPGNDVIPYIGALFGTGTLSVSNVSGTVLDTGGVLGLTWFPFSQIFAFDLALGMTSAQTDFSGTKSTTSSTSIQLGWAVYF